MHSAAAVSGVWLDVVAPLLPLVRAPVTAADARGGGCAATVAPAWHPAERRGGNTGAAAAAVCVMVTAGA
eukprot:scaffold218197_cov12-Tisochrysis_lutea.AAC.1